MFNLSELTPSLLKAVLKASLPDIEPAIAKNFREGELIKGKIVRNLGGDAAIVKLKDMELVAKIPRTLQANETILVKVDKVSPQLMVSLLPNSTPVEEKAAALLRLYLPQAKAAGPLVSELAKVIASLPEEVLKKSGIKEVLEDIRKTFFNEEEQKPPKDRAEGDKGEKIPKEKLPKEFPDKTAVRDRPDEFPGKGSVYDRGEQRRGAKGGKEKPSAELPEKKNLLQLLGMSHEADLAKGKPVRNLKSALMQLQQNLEKFAEKEPEKFREPLARVVGAIRNIELRQLKSLDDARPVKGWDIPVWNGQEAVTARVYVHKEGSRGGDKKGETPGVTKVSVMVEMSALGAVRAELASTGKMLSGTIYVEDEEKAVRVGNGLKGLEENLRKLGFEPTLATRVAAKEFLTEDRDLSIDLPVKGLLSVKA